MISKHIEKNFYKVNGIIYEINSISDKCYNIVVARSSGKKYISFMIFKDKIDSVGFKLKDRVKIKFKIQCEYLPKYTRWVNSLFIVDILHWRKNDNKLTREENLENYYNKKREEVSQNKSMSWNGQ